jgi:hypothetical protein
LAAAGRGQQAADLLADRHLVRPMIIAFPAANVGWLRDGECLNGRDPLVFAGQHLA